MRWLVAAALLVAGLAPCVGQPARDDDITHAELRALLEKAQTRHDVPALAAGMLLAGERRLAAVGVRKRGAEAKATADDLWHIGSNTKPITALLIALLIDLGLLDWDTPLERIFPETRAAWPAELNRITPQQLLTHTSGLPANWPGGWFQIPRKGSPAQQRKKMVQELGAVKLTAKPGEKYVYSNLGYVVLGAIIDVRGQGPWEEQIDKRVFRPLGIRHWGLGPAGKKNVVAQPWPHHASGQPVAASAVRDNPPVMNSAGRLHIATADYLRLLGETIRLARGDKGLLKPATASKLFSNPYPVSPHSLSGWLGFRKQPGDKGLILAHDGSNTLNYCTAIVSPDRQRAVCVFTNQGTLGGPGQMACRDLVKSLRAVTKR